MYFLIIFLSLRSDVKPLVPFTVFRHFSTNGKKITVSINFSVKNKIGSKRVNNILYSISSNFGHFPTIPDYFKRSAKTIEDFRRSKLPKMEEDYRWFPRRNLIIFIFIFVIIYSHVKVAFFYSVQIRLFQWEKAM